MKNCQVKTILAGGRVGQLREQQPRPELREAKLHRLHHRLLQVEAEGRQLEGGRELVSALPR